MEVFLILVNLTLKGRILHNRDPLTLNYIPI